MSNTHHFDFSIHHGGGVAADQSDVHQQTFCSLYQSFSNEVGSTFGHKTVNNNNNNSKMLSVLSPNSFDGMGGPVPRAQKKPQDSREFWEELERVERAAASPYQDDSHAFDQLHQFPGVVTHEVD
uniref:Uncharacterized protein n=1 Tax=Globodera rostochiensis TaxID=31243 RepID=A0A914HTX3_GLORO